MTKTFIQELHPQNQNGEKSFDKSEKIVKKKCLGCCDIFACYQSQNYDYCSSCELNSSRCLNKDSPCSECDGSGLIKFKNQPPRSCKLCHLAKQENQGEEIFAK